MKLIAKDIELKKMLGSEWSENDSIDIQYKQDFRREEPDL